MKQLAGLVIIVLLLFGVLPLLPVKATEPANWSKPRPTTTRDFYDSLGNATNSSDGQATLALGVGVNKYITGGNGVYDALRFTIDLSASTRDGINYDWVYHGNSYSWVTVNQPLGISGDDSYVLVNLGFSVLFYGINYSSMYVFSNGFISFTSPTYASASPVPLPSASINDTIVAPFWRKLKLSQGGSITTGHVSYSWPGDPTSSYQVFTWNNIPDVNGHPQTFQLLIEDRPAQGWNFAYHNRIFFQYLSVTNDLTTTIGVQDRIGHHGNTYPLSQITNQSIGGFTTYGVYGLGYRITQVSFAVTKVGSDSNAKMDLQSTYEGGSNIDLNTTGDNTGFGPLFATAIEGGVNALLDWCGVGEAINGLFVIWDLGVATAGADYEPASGTLNSATWGQTQATGLANAFSSAQENGEYQHETFDASFSDLVYWSFADPWPNCLEHAVTVTATALYRNEANPNQGGFISTSVTLDIYPGPHYVDVGSGLVAGANNVLVSGINCWVDGQVSSTPISELILPEGYHNITVPMSINVGNTQCIFNAWGGPDGGGLTTNQYVGTFTSDKNLTAEYLIPGDINQDGGIDIYDAILLSGAFNSHPGNPNWNPQADINKDGCVDIYDAIILSNNFNKWASALVGGSGFSGKSLSFGKMALGGASIFVDPSQVTVFKNEVFSVNVNVASVTDLAGWEFKLYWNSTVLNCTNVTIQSPVEWQNNTQDYGTGLENSYNSTHGRFYRAETAAYPSPSFNGSMTIATLTFQALQPGTTTLALMDTKLGNSTADPIDHTESSGSVEVSNTRYMRSDTQTVNNLNAYLLNATETSTVQTDYRQTSGGHPSYWGIRAWMRCPNGTEVEIQLSNHTGTPQAVIVDYSSTIMELSATTAVTAKTWVANASLVVRVYFSWDNSSWTNIVTFTTEKLAVTLLKSTTWTVYYDVFHYYNFRVNKSFGYFYWGDSSRPSRIENLQFT